MVSTNIIYVYNIYIYIYIYIYIVIAEMFGRSRWTAHTSITNAHGS